MQTVHHRRKASVPRVVWLLVAVVALAALTAGWLLVGLPLAVIGAALIILYPRRNR